MKEEYGLMIIWNNARFCEERIIEDVKKRFDLINKFEIKWDNKLFSENLSRFYGENLPKNSFKEKHCGNGEFLLLILKDNNPIYSYRRTSKGKKMVNVNFFDSKELYRSWTGLHMVHATNDVAEFKHDIMLLLGMNLDDYKKKYKKSEEVIRIENNIIGSGGWENLEQVFYVLNDTIKYVVLRNFQSLPKNYEIGEHGDIDFLCDNKYNMMRILNAKKVNKSKSRVRYTININNQDIYIDIRYIGDKYYDEKWEKTILNNRILKNGFFIPKEDDYSYSLLYHALVHKRIISNDYLEIFEKEFSTSNNDELKEKLKKYLIKNDYKFIEPSDISVFYNSNTTMEDMSLRKKIYFRFYFIFRIIKI